MKQMLAAPVEFGDTLLAPTTELAGLAELSHLHSQDDRLAAIVRIAAAIKQEDLARSEIRSGRDAEKAGLTVLPKRNRRPSSTKHGTRMAGRRCGTGVLLRPSPPCGQPFSTLGPQHHQRWGGAQGRRSWL